MTSTVRRAAGFAAVSSLALAVPWSGMVAEPALATLAAIGPFLAVAAIALVLPSEHVLFELFARPGDRRDGTLHSLAGFALAAAGLAIISIGFGMPPHVYVATVLIVGFGNLGGQLVRTVSHDPIRATGGFVLGGFLAATVGQALTVSLGAPTADLPWIAFLAAAGSLLAALMRELLFKHDDALVLVTVGLLLWLFASVPVEITPTRIVVALGVTLVLGYLSFALETASLPGMLTGVLLGLVTIVFGDYGWFAMLIAFFAIGGLSSKFRYEEKVARGIAEANRGARGTGNVLANSLVALVAVLAGAASHGIGLPSEVFLYAFAGAVAAALADTLSSEIGGLYDNPRLITSFELVDPGTDGAVTWQGQVAGLAGGAIIAAIGILTFEGIPLVGGGIILFAAVVGMTVDSLLGASIEGWLCGNQGVNFLATLAAGLVGAWLPVAAGLVAI